MSWFTKLCRNMGLMIHNVKHPSGQKSDKQVVSREVEEEQLNDKVTLRRTTIEEVEIKRDGDGD